jgi:hypothetical protein
VTSAYARTTINSQAAPKYYFSLKLSTDCIFVWLPLNTTLVISFHSRRASTATAQDYYRWPHSQIRRGNRQKVYKNGLRQAISILATNTTCKLYVLSAPHFDSLVIHITVLWLCSNRRYTRTSSVRINCRHACIESALRSAGQGSRFPLQIRHPPDQSITRHLVRRQRDQYTEVLGGIIATFL